MRISKNMSCKKNIYQTKIFLISALLSLSFLLFSALPVYAFTPPPYSATYQSLINPTTQTAIGCNSMSDCQTYYGLSCDTDKNCKLDKKAWQGSPAISSFTGDTCEYQNQVAAGLCGDILCKDGSCVLAQPTAAGRNEIISTLAQSKATPSTKKPFITLDPILNLQVKLPGLEKLAADTPAVCTTEGDRTSCSLPWISIYIKAVYNYAMGIVGILAALALMIGGVIYLTSAGSATRISEAKSWITGALTGMLIMFTSYVLLNEVNPDLIGFKPIKLNIVGDMSPDNSDSSTNPPTIIDAAGINPYSAGCHHLDICQQFAEDNVQPAGLVTPEDKYLEDPSKGERNMINSEIYELYKAATDCINPDKVIYKIGNSWRSAQLQIDFKTPGNKYGVDPANAATPCCSNHGGALAIDLSPGIPDNDSKAIKCFADNGLKRNRDVAPATARGGKGGENWHVSRSGF